MVEQVCLTDPTRSLDALHGKLPSRPCAPSQNRCEMADGILTSDKVVNCHAASSRLCYHCNAVAEIVALSSVLWKK